jgi:hypothetical protein
LGLEIRFSFVAKLVNMNCRTVIEIIEWSDISLEKVRNNRRSLPLIPYCGLARKFDRSLFYVTLLRHRLKSMIGDRLI